MKVNFEIDWENFEDRREVQNILISSSYKSVLADLDNYLRGIIKYDSGESENTPHLDAYQAVRTRLWELCTDEKVDPHGE